MTLASLEFSVNTITIRLSSFLSTFKAMVTSHLRATYGVYFIKQRKILQFYGVRPAAGRMIRFLIICYSRYRTVPGEVSVLLKIPRRPFGVWKGHWGKMTVRCPVGVCTHRTGTRRFGLKFIVRCLISARKLKNLNKSADACPGTGRCPSGYWSMFYESNSHR